MTYLVVIGDVIASRSIRDRQVFQAAMLRALLARTGADAPSTLISPYTLTLGDEFQAVRSRARGVFCDLLSIARDLHPVGLRFALAIGDVETAINPRQAIGMDGSAFHRARDGIDRLKEDRARCRVDGLDPPLSTLINEALRLAFARLADVRGTRLALSADLLRGRPVRAMAERLGKSEQTLYKTIRTADLHSLVALLGAVEDLIDPRLEEPSQA